MKPQTGAADRVRRPWPAPGVMPLARAVPATLVGVRAAAALVDGATGHVPYAFNGTAYVELDGGLILWLGGPGGVPHGRVVLAAVPLGAELGGAAVQIHGGEVQIGDRARIALAGAPRWQPPPPLEPPPGAASGVDTIGIVVGALVSDGTHAGAAPGLRRLADRSALSVRLVSHAMRPLAGAGAGVRLAEVADAFLGLGPGLTPSGDDFTGGFAFALRTGGILPPGDAEGDTAAATLVQAARRQTTKVSAALLADYLAGEGPEPLHRLAAAVERGVPEEALREARRLVSIGQTTGWATFTGFVAGLNLSQSGTGDRQGPREE